MPFDAKPMALSDGTHQLQLGLLGEGLTLRDGGMEEEEEEEPQDKNLWSGFLFAVPKKKVGKT